MVGFDGKVVRRFFSDEEGQGITEYGAIIAFVSLLVALTFSAANGSLMPAVSRAFREASSQLNALSSAAASSS
ncbi:MAG: hypothetical protein J0M35_09670 [Candidatus Obscuribacter phosphatis]|jgi:Flp pilus assembly pilin Flp|uniref:Flp family type IVb pilin n=1 Tax=Candidatus Obscuribacter phosphatis TaxID=1906157 RepID=A0A8J7P7X5_9BACT|nr:hypothetical protein [Candidatus Obscuribacter phosphatis]